MLWYSQVLCNNFEPITQKRICYDSHRYSPLPVSRQRKRRYDMVSSGILQIRTMENDSMSLQLSYCGLIVKVTSSNHSGRYCIIMIHRVIGDAVSRCHWIVRGLSSNGLTVSSDRITWCWLWKNLECRMDMERLVSCQNKLYQSISLYVPME